MYMLIKGEAMESYAIQYLKTRKLNDDIINDSLLSSHRAFLLHLSAAFAPTLNRLDLALRLLVSHHPS